MEKKDIVEAINQIIEALAEVVETDTGTGDYLENKCEEALNLAMTLKKVFQE
jgi:hypothetical protein